MSSDPIREQLVELTGEQYQTRRVAQDPVCAVLVRRWLEAFGDVEVLQQGNSRAIQGGALDMIAPPAMLASFTGRSLSEMRVSLSGSSELGGRLAELGFVTPGVGIRQEYARDIRVGDTVTETSWPEHIGESKQTRLGKGYFISYRSDFNNQHGDYLGRQRLTTYAFQPRHEAVATPSDKEASPDPRKEQQMPPSLPAWEVSLDRMGIIACTMAMGDFNPGHYDPDLAKASGFKDIFTDIYSSVGFAQTYTRTHSGPEARIASIDLKLGVPLYPGDTLRISGFWGERRGEQCDLHVSGECAAGMHFGGTVSLVTPE